MNKFFDYLKASKSELGKVTWPDRRKTVQLSGVVIVFSVVMAATLGAVDFGFTTILQKLILKG